jgi:hypothetical protein
MDWHLAHIYADKDAARRGVAMFSRSNMPAIAERADLRAAIAEQPDGMPVQVIATGYVDGVGEQQVRWTVQPVTGMPTLSKS